MIERQDAAISRGIVAEWKPLAEFCRSAMPIGSFLQLAVNLSAALAALHRKLIVHRRLTPESILVGVPTWQVDLERLRDPAVTSTATADMTQLKLALPYMAPEQGGRMNQRLDHRSDVYSLGVIFYQLLTGTLPFRASDPLEWLHAHVARVPLPPPEVNPTVPQALSEIVMKLLAKPLEARYQSTSGLQADLVHCLTEWQIKGVIEPFPLGARDITERLHVPQKLYGRTAELQRLVQSYERVAEHGAAELVLVTGAAGVGKSALVAELEKAVLAQGGTFSAGKFDQYKRHMPYVTLGEALRRHILTLLAGSDQVVADWSHKLKAAVNGSGALVVELIPQTRFLLEPQPTLPSLSTQEARQRFLNTLRRFITALATPAHPLVLFLDDLQWADPASLEFLQHLLQHAESRYVLVVGTYRDTEATPSHPLSEVLDGLRRSAVAVNDVHLAPLASVPLERMLAETLHSSLQQIRPLARLIHQKTAGNPFFATQFLKRLEHEGLIRFVPEAMSWSWNLKEIKAEGYTDNVIDLMIDNLKQLLPQDSLSLLQLAACIGQRGELALLAKVSQAESEDVLREQLHDALAAGFIELTEDNGYQFAHDRIQQAVYTLMPKEQRAQVHLQIGRELLARTPEEALGECIFDIANQLNAGHASVSDRDECLRVAELNLRACRKAREASAFVSSVDYCCAGAARLPADSWESHYELTFALNLSCAECKFLIGNHAGVEQRLALLLPHAANGRDAAAVARLQVQLYMLQGQVTKAMDAGLTGLQKLGLTIPSRPSREQVEAVYEQVWQQLGERPIEALLDAPDMHNADAVAAQDLLLLLVESAHLVDRYLYALLVCHSARLGLEHGNSASSSYAYVTFGMLLIASFGQYDRGLQFGKVAVALVEKQNSVGHKIRVKYQFGHMISPWKRPFRESFAALPNAAEAVTIGDIALACFVQVGNLGLRLTAGEPLPELLRESESALDFARKVQFIPIVLLIQGMQRFIMTMCGQTHSFSTFSDVDFDQAAFEADLRDKAGDFGAIVWFYYNIRKLQARFLSCDYDEAIAAAEQVRGVLGTMLAYPHQTEYYYFSALALAARCEDAPRDQRQAWLDTLHAHQAKLKDWAEHCPENYLTKYALVSAELARLEGDDWNAMQLYDRAIRAAHDNGLVHNEAIAYEIEARFLLTHGLETNAITLLQRARACYRQWGADGKVKQLEQEFPAWLPQTAPGAAAQEFTGSPGQIDLLAVAKAAQSISSEVVQERLHETLMRVVLEQVGAQSGQLLLCEEDELCIQAQVRFDRDGYHVQSLQALPLGSDQVPMAVLNTVRHTHEPLLLDDASSDPAYADDDYIQRRQPRSMLCLPILRHQSLTGLLYLENNHLPGAFAGVNLEVLELLVSQVAISLENASLYKHLQQSQERLAAVMDNIPALVYVKDPEGRLLYMNRQWESMFGRRVDDIVGKTERDVLPEEVFDKIRTDDIRVMSQGQTATFEESFLLGDGKYHTFLTVKVPLYREGQVHGLCGISLNITEQKLAHERLDYLAHYDALTGLANRVLLADHLNLALANARRNGHTVAVLFLDLDRFKIVNDSLGHRIGDLLLKEVAHRLKACVREVDTVSRLSGDEFVVVITDLMSPGIVRQSAQKIIQSLSSPCNIEGHELRVGCSVGISLFPQDAQDTETLLKHADLAMYHAKATGRKNFQFFSHPLNARAQERLLLESSLRLALERGELYLHYQPQVDLASHKIIGAEALIRWRHPQRGLVSPTKFVPVAEDSGLIIEISHWVLGEACRQARRWQDMGLPRLTISVNVSAVNFQRDHLVASVTEALHNSGLAPELLELELTEGVLMSEVDTAIVKLTALKELGVGLAIDDFGTGYSSLSYLKRFPVDKLKIDQSFVRDITHDPDDAAITSTIIAMAKSLRLKVIAEGVEDTGAERFLEEHLCDEMQGFLVSPPVSAEAFAELFRH